MRNANVCKCRSVTELKSIDELELSTSRKAFIKKKQISLEELVIRGRYYAYYYYNNEFNSFKWWIEVIEALDKAGYIRHDLGTKQDASTFVIGKLYREIWYNLEKDSFKDLYEGIDEVLASNAIYESYRPLCYEMMDDVQPAVKKILKRDRLYELFALRYDIDSGVVRNLRECAEACNEDNDPCLYYRLARAFDKEDPSKHYLDKVKQMDYRIHRMLQQNRTELPGMYMPASSKEEDELKEVLRKLKQLYEDNPDVLAEERKLLAEAHRLATLPYWTLGDEYERANLPVYINPRRYKEFL